MINKELFFKGYKANLDKDKKLTQKEVDSLNWFIDRVNSDYSRFTHKQWAYIFATVFHETNGRFDPVIEAYWLSENWRKNNLRYYPFYGRGFVQITWEELYIKFGKILGVDLKNNPQLACDKEIAFKIMTIGMQNGLFTGRRLANYISGSMVNYKGARSIINGNDKSDLIENYAKYFETIVQ